MTKKTSIIVLLIIVLGVGWYLARPLFVDDVVNEDLPEGITLEELDALIEMPSEEEIASMTEEEKQAAEMMLMEKADQMDIVVNETMEEAEAMAPPNDNPAALPNDAFPIVFASGSFRDADDFHKGSGRARLIMVGDETTIARLEDFEVTNGPDLFVYLTKHENPQSSADVKEGFVDLGRLKGNKGNQNYEIPSDIDLNEYNSIIIYCRAFSTLFSVAPLS